MKQVLDKTLANLSQLVIIIVISAKMNWLINIELMYLASIFCMKRQTFLSATCDPPNFSSS